MKKIIYIFAAIILLSISTYGQVSVIANKGVGESSLDVAKLSNVYSLVVTKWNNGTKVVVFENSASDLKKAFYGYIGKDPMAMKKEWLKKQLTGQGKAPAVISSDAEIIAKVASTPGAIAYVKSSSVTGDVKVLTEIK